MVASVMLVMPSPQATHAGLQDTGVYWCGSVGCEEPLRCVLSCSAWVIVLIPILQCCQYLWVSVFTVHPLKGHRWGTGQKRCPARARRAPGALTLPLCCVLPAFLPECSPCTIAEPAIQICGVAGACTPLGMPATITHPWVRLLETLCL